jgi:hypothetical protein
MVKGGSQYVYKNGAFSTDVYNTYNVLVDVRKWKSVQISLVVEVRQC